jgi:purine nucleosidase
MQSPFEGKQPLGVVYDTSMDRPDAALALALLYGFQGKRESRMASVCVNGAGLGAAVFCDLVQRFYTPGPMRNANQVLMPGLAADGPLPSDPVLVTAAVERKNEKGEPQYVRSIRRVGDTSLPEAVIRNGVIFNAEAVMILSARATYLAKSLDLDGVPELYKQRVKMLVVVDSGNPQDVPAMRKVLAEFPAPVVFSGRDIGQALPFPGACIDKDFAWTPAHPIVDAYHAFRPGVYDFPSHDLAAALYAVHPDKDFFKLSDAGTIVLGDDGIMKFAAGAGKTRSLIFDPSRMQAVLQTFVEVASAKPVIPQPRRPRSADGKAGAKPATAPPDTVKPEVKTPEKKPGT